ncbi:MAG: hypothetical protein IKY09_05495, partial [Methanocorpusculum sp.]|nr:hypothetical protein [Methanocorpusculum sp.]
MKYEKVPNSIYEEYPDAYDSQYIIEDELIRKETEADLFCLFDEIDEYKDYESNKTIPTIDML